MTTHENDPAPFRPVFVVGFPRSGTTLLATLLDRHAELAATPETHFFSQIARRSDKTAMTHESALRTFLNHPRTADLNLDPLAMRTRFAQRTPTWGNLFQAAMEEHARVYGARRVVEKTPLHLLHVPRLLRLFPDAQVVYVMRDGRDAVLSLMRAPWTHNNLRRHAAEWVRRTKIGQRFLRRYPRAMLSARFEDIVTQPREELARITRFLGVPFDEAMLNASGLSPAIPEWEAAWKAKAGETLDATRVYSYRREATPDQLAVMNSMMGALLQRAGYGDTGLPGLSPGARLKHRILNALFRTVYHPAVKPLFALPKRGITRLGVPADRLDAPDAQVDELAACYRLEQADDKER